MSGNVGKPLVTTNQDRCKACCTCVRECPAKAIRIHRGKAEVLPERCVGCGNCVKTCNMKALLVRSSAELFDAVLSSGVESSAVIDPAFPAEFTGMDYRVFVGMVKSLGFTYVNEGAFGADLVAERYRKLLEANPDGRYIGTNCPALINYVEMYHPDLTGRLAPIVSPMVATARALRKLYGSDLKVVFIGPCIARKTETDDPSVKDEIDAVLTFEELREIFEARGIEAGNVTPVDFDPPHAGLGALFPLAGGMLQAAGIEEDLVSGDIVTAGGMRSFQDALKEMESGTNARLLDILCCDGCIMGPGMTTPDRRFRRRSSISAYARGRLSKLDSDSRLTGIDRFRDLDLSRTFAAHDMRMKRPSRQELRPVLEKLGKHGPEDELNCGACGYETCHDHAVAIFDGLAESEMCLPHTIDLLKSALSDLESSHAELADAREALEHAEKMATMGQLAAGIAHEVNNPLGIVLMYAHMLLDNCEENPAICDDLRMIAEQADRCRKIVSGLLDFARQNKVVHQPTDVPELIQRTVSLVTLPPEIAVECRTETDDPIAELDPDQIAQVITNLVTNAIAAMPAGGLLKFVVGGDEQNIRIDASDNGVGIQPADFKRIFDPFFTTKKIGKGTGLGLAVTYGIVKMHRGQISAVTNADPSTGPTGTTFTVILPRSAPEE
ncbi:MAG TPA: [Fe-Fe] hydrogenase large subunit C-terminal domain-containing protein [Candidatus Fermentibacter daniensis]|nr:[Fe-Fe] hydrogenase large subunit C-terminal domain-containing protein [Candidatus Fermentibacter daniensis]